MLLFDIFENRNFVKLILTNKCDSNKEYLSKKMMQDRIRMEMITRIIFVFNVNTPLACLDKSQISPTNGLKSTHFHYDDRGRQ